MTDGGDNEEPLYRLEWAPFVYRGRLLMFGYPLFGGWLPFIGWITLYSKDGESTLQAFSLEWLLRGILIIGGAPEDNEQDEDDY